MGRKRYSAEQIIVKLREAEVFYSWLNQDPRYPYQTTATSIYGIGLLQSEAVPIKGDYFWPCFFRVSLLIPLLGLDGHGK